jgi:DNA polymerase III delta subunit
MKSSAARSKAGSGTAPPAIGRRAHFDPLGHLERGSLPETLYLEGPSEALKTAILQELKRAWAESCPSSPWAHVFRASESSVEEILANFLGASLFSPGELSIVLEIEDLGRSEKRIVALAEGIARPPGGSCLILVESAADQPRKSLEPLRLACQYRYQAFPPRPAELMRWGKLRLERERLEVGPGVLEALLQASEGDALSFFGELDKLCTWGARDRRVVKEDVAALLRPVVGADLQGYLAAVANGDPRQAAQRLGRVLSAGAGEGSVLFALTNLVSGALGGWARYRDLSLVLARRSSQAELARSLDLLFRGEAAWKGGRADVVAVLEQATRTLSAPRPSSAARTA